MIDLDQAAAELTASVAHVPPDLPRIQQTARRRQRRHRAVLAVAAIAVLAAGGAAALGAAGDDRDREDVHAGPKPGAASPKAEDLVDYGNLRITVPDGWVSVTTDEYPDGTCEAEGLILVGPDVVVPEACIGVPAIEVRTGAAVTSGGRETRFSDAGIQIELVERTDRQEVWTVPSLDGQITTRHGADPVAVLDSVAPSARSSVFRDLAPSVASAKPVPTTGRTRMAFEGVELSVPSSWGAIPHVPDGEDGDPCQRWRQIGPDAVSGATGNARCDDGRSWVPRDGVWLLPLDATSVDADFPENDRLTIGDLDVTVVWDVRFTVLEVVVPGSDGDADVLVRVGLGTDPDTASSIVRSLGRVPDAAITLPCDLTAVADRTALDLPDDLNVSVLQGMGGTGELEPCAVNLTATHDPGRHISFVASEMAGSTDRLAEGTRPVRWGPIHEGYGAELEAVGSDATISVVGYGVTEAEFEALVDSLAASEG